MRKIVLLHNIRSMYNVGSFFRTCDAAGIEKMYITGYTAYPPRSQISKTALGAEDEVPWEYVNNPMEVVKSLRTEGWKIIGIEKNASSVDMNSVHFEENEKVCFIFGNEVEGVSSLLLENVDAIIHIPMYGKKESLNVAVCGGIILYHDFRK